MGGEIIQLRIDSVDDRFFLEVVVEKKWNSILRIAFSLLCNKSSRNSLSSTIDFE